MNNPIPSPNPQQSPSWPSTTTLLAGATPLQLHYNLCHRRAATVAPCAMPASDSSPRFPSPPHSSRSASHGIYHPNAFLPPYHPNTLRHAPLCRLPSPAIRLRTISTTPSTFTTTTIIKTLTFVGHRGCHQTTSRLYHPHLLSFMLENASRLLCQAQHRAAAVTCSNSSACSPTPPPFQTFVVISSVRSRHRRTRYSCKPSSSS
ncbi:proline-rich receptor-like protein kinase PERK2 [Iris pallida]|uniref:Proline-rich receptor-like protein kinase PERK2 n=1 Tax=Iris pallida TaxID=29817 RepID=A0AAX6E781_IRIPA|nr:proline-rich receptor-like protein kinase PERK2 [Iris pallida]